MRKRWLPVSMRELRQVWAYLREQDVCFNGCTNAELIRRYGEENIKHKMGDGWYKRVESKS